MSRTRKSVWSLATGVLFNLVWALTGFLATPWLLRWLGSERFGVYKILLDWMGYLALLELAINGALIGILAPRVAKSDASQVRSLLAAGLRAYTWVMFATFIVGIGWVMVLPDMVSLLKVSSHELRLGGLVSLLVLFLIPLSIFRSLAETRQKHYLFNLLMIGQSILMTLLWLGAAWAGWGLPGQSFAFVVAQIPAAFVLFWDAKKEYGSIRSTPPDPVVKRDLWALNKPTLTHTLTERIGFIGDNIIVGWILGPLFVVPFYLTQRLMTLAQMQIQSVSHSTWAALTELHSLGKTQLFRQRLFDITSTVSGLGLAILGPIAAYNEHLIHQWVGANNYAGGLVTITACINIWLSCIFYSWIRPIVGVGETGRWAPYAVVFTILKITLSVILTFKFGIAGPLFGTLLGFLLLESWALPRVLHQAFHVSPSILWKTALSPLSWGLLYAVALSVIARSHRPWGLAGLVLEMGLAFLGGLLLYWTLSLDKNSRSQWRDRLSLVVNY